jgi:hypothetical protein
VRAVVGGRGHLGRSRARCCYPQELPATARTRPPPHDETVPRLETREPNNQTQWNDVHYAGLTVFRGKTVCLCSGSVTFMRAADEQGDRVERVWEPALGGADWRERKEGSVQLLEV